MENVFGLDITKILFMCMIVIGLVDATEVATAAQYSHGAFILDSVWDSFGWCHCSDDRKAISCFSICNTGKNSPFVIKNASQIRMILQQPFLQYSDKLVSFFEA